MNSPKSRRLPGLLLTAPLLLFLWGCADSSGDSLSAAVAPPENLADHYTINWVADISKAGRYDSVTGNIGLTNCLQEVDDINGWKADAGSLIQSTTFQMVKDKKSLYDQTNASYASSVNAKVYKTSTEYKMTNELQMDSNSIWALLKIDITGPTVVRQSKKMNASYFNKAAPVDTDLFRDECGDMAVYRIHTGARFYGLLKITVKNLSEKNNVEAHMSSVTGSGGVNFKTKADFANKFSMSEDSFSITSYVYTSGGMTSRVVESVEDLTGMATDWVNDMYTLFQGPSQHRVDLWASGSTAVTYNANKLNDLVTNNAVSADFVSYTLDADWGTAPIEIKPVLMSGRAMMGDMGRAYVSTSSALEHLGSVLNSPELYVTSHKPLVLFGESKPGLYPMLQPHSTHVGYAIADSVEAVDEIKDVYDRLTTSKEQILEAAKVCTDDPTAVLDLVDLCENKACEPVNYLKNAPYSTSAADCEKQCKGKKRCDIAYEYFFNDPSSDILEIEKNLYGNPVGLPDSVSFRHAEDYTWQTVYLPERRYVVPTSCRDYKSEVGGGVLPDGEYLFYYDGNPDKPLYLYCRSMDKSSPTTYLTLPNSRPVDSTTFPEPNHTTIDGYANYSGLRSASGWEGNYFQKYRVYQSEGYLWLADDAHFSHVPSSSSFYHVNAASHDDQWSSFDLDVRGTPLEIAHDQLWLGGGWVNYNPQFHWYTTKILAAATPTTQAEKHANLVVQKLRASINGDHGHILPILPTDLGSIYGGNDGDDYLYPIYNHGPIRFTYIDRDRQSTVHANLASSQTHTTEAGVTHKTDGPGDRIISFDTSVIP